MSASSAVVCQGTSSRRSATPSAVARCACRCLLGPAADDDEPRRPGGVHAGEDLDGVDDPLLRHEPAGDHEHELVVVERLRAGREQRVVVAEREHVDQAGEALAAGDGGGLGAAWVERGDAAVRGALVLRERRREALVDVLGRVHDDREVRRGGGEPLAGGDAERLFVDVEDVRTQRCERSR